jgi:esterase/lipase superfamily enzyme
MPVGYDDEGDETAKIWQVSGRRITGDTQWAHRKRLMHCNHGGSRARVSPISTNPAQGPKARWLPCCVRWLAISAAIGLSLACGACSSRPSQGALIPVAEAAEGTSRVRVLAATTRRRSTTDAGDMFSGERAEAVSYASIAVSIPPDGSRQIGQVQWPTAIPGDPRRNFVTISADYLDKHAFAEAVTAVAKQTGRSKVLVFVHGFNNRFDDAVYRLAQIVHDSKAPVIPVLFTWPSRGEVRLRAYTYDRESANYSRDALEQLLDMLATYPSVTEISILAHSMGNWIALEALRGRSMRSRQFADKIRADKLKNAMLVAPDVDVDVFRAQIQRMGASRPRIALFLSQDDRALSFSQFIWGDVPRLGQVDPNQEPYRSEFERDRIEVFDLTRLKSVGGNAHNIAFEDVTSVVAMIKQRMKEGQEMTDGAPNLGDQLEQASALGK